MNEGRLEQQSLALSSLMRGEECPNMNPTVGGQGRRRVRV